MAHASGNPWSHPLNAGFNWPPLSIPAEQPVNIVPSAVMRAGPLTVGQQLSCQTASIAVVIGNFSFFRLSTYAMLLRSIVSSAIGVIQPDRTKECSLSDVRRPDARSRYI